MKWHKSLLWVGLFLILSSSIYAAPPILQLSQTSTGLTIIYPQTNSYLQNREVHLNFHVYNGSNRIVTKNSPYLNTTCNIHIYDQLGDHFLNKNLKPGEHNIDWELNLTPTNTSILGRYSYIVQCNNTIHSGYLSNSYEIVDQQIDENNRDTSAGLSVVIFISLIALGFLVLPFFKEFDKSSKLSDRLIARGCWVIGIYLLTLNCGIVATIAKASNLNVTGELFLYMWILGTIGWVLMGYMVLRMIIDVITDTKEKRMRKRMGDNEQ